MTYFVHMDTRALEFMRGWPEVPEALKPVYQRLYDAKIIATPPGKKWAVGPLLTNLGSRLEDWIDEHSQNLFPVDFVLGLWGDILHMQRPDQVNFLKLFGLTYDDPRVIAYLAGERQEFSAKRHGGLRAAMARLETAMDRAARVRA